MALAAQRRRRDSRRVALSRIRDDLSYARRIYREGHHQGGRICELVAVEVRDPPLTGAARAARVQDHLVFTASRSAHPGIELQLLLSRELDGLTQTRLDLPNHVGFARTARYGLPVHLSALMLRRIRLARAKAR